MVKTFAFTLVILMVAVALWGIFFENNSITILINGQEIDQPLKGMVGFGGIVIASIALIGLAILLAFAFAGTGVIIMGCMIVGSVLFMAFLFPLLLSLVIPLTLIWIFITLLGRKI